MFQESHNAKGMEEIVDISPANKEIVSITEAAERHNVTPQAIYVALKHHKLKAVKAPKSGRWFIALKDLEEYRKLKYSRTKSTYDGELLFDNKKGYFSVNQVAEMLDVPPQKIYYATRKGLIRASRKGAAWIIHNDDIKDYQKNYLDRKSSNSEVS